MATDTQDRSRDIVSLCVERRACGETAHNFDEKENFSFPHHCTLE